MVAMRRSYHKPARRGPGERARRLRGAGGLLTGLLGVALVAMLAFAAGPAAAAGPAFDAATPTVFVAQGGPTQLEQAVESNGHLVFQNVGPAAGFQYNAIAYDTVDNYIYGIADQAAGTVAVGDVIQIAADGSVTDTGVNAGAAFVVAAWDPTTDEVYFYNGTTGTMFVYNPATGTTRTLTLSGTPAVLDLTYADGYFWGTDATSTAAAPVIVRIDPTTGTATSFNVPAGLFPGAADVVFGAAWTYGNGNIGFSSNTTGEIYQVSVANAGAASPTFTLVSHQPGPPNGSNDGAANPGEPTDLGITKTATPAAVADGGQITYTLSVVNYGPGNSSGYVVSDTLPAGLTNAATTTTGCSITSGVVTCQGNPLDAGHTATPITITANVPSPFVAAVTNSATVTSNEQDPNSSNNTGTATVNPQADLSIAKSVSPARVTPGQNSTFTLVARNNGPNPASNVRVSDTIPAGLTVASVGPGCTASGQTVTCTVGSLAPGASQAFTVTTRAASTLDHDIANTATVTSDTDDPNPGNNTTTIPVPVAQADLSIVKSTTSDTVVAGTNETYRLVVKNNGPDAAVNTVVSDPLPAGLTFVSAGSGCSNAGSDVTCTIASLASGASQTFTVTARVASSVDHALDNTATVRSDLPDPDSSNNSSTTHVPVRGEADLSITKTPSTTTVGPNGQVLYTLVVKNAGPSDATGVKVSDAPPNGLTLQSAKGSQGACAVAGGKLSCSLGTIVAGGSAQVLVTAQATATASGTLENTATVTGDQHDSDSGNNGGSSTVVVTPTPQPTAELGITKKVNHAKSTLGQPLTYTVVVTNHGPSTATRVKVIDALSVPGKLVSVKSTAGSCKKALPLTCSLGTIRSGGKVTITVVVIPKVTGAVRNSASVTGQGLDPKTANNIDGASASVAKPTLGLSKTANHATIKAGQTITYTIKVTNPTALAITNVRTCDNLPSGLVYVSSKAKAKLSKGQYCWSAKSIGAHKTISYQLTARALKGTSGTKTNTAIASSPNARTGKARRLVKVAAGQVKAGGVTG